MFPAKASRIRLYLPVFLVQLAKDLEVDSETTSYLVNRLRKEGVHVVTSLLPSFSKWVLRCIENNKLDKSFTHFAWKGRFPRYFRGLLTQIFDLGGRAIVSTDASVALYQIRSFCEYFYKLAFDFTLEDKRSALAKYLSIEAEIRDYSPQKRWLSILRSNLRYYPRFTGAKPEDILAKHRPRDTSGSTFGMDVNASNRIRRSTNFVSKTCRFDQRAFSGFFRPYPSCKERIRLNRHEGKTSEVMFVPKDSRGPRTISKEPLHLLRGQMSFFDFAVDSLEKDSKSGIRFRDQSVNRELARVSSIDRSWATLDLRDASDRISYDLVLTLVNECPGLRYFITRMRSTHTKLPNGDIITLRKLAGMGSGLTFPFLAFLCHLSVCSYVCLRHGKSYMEVAPRVHVYGDDVVIPNEWYDAAVRGLSASGLVVNTDKSYERSHFRESCGGDYYLGNDTTPVRLKLTQGGLASPQDARDGILKLSGDGALLQLERHARELVKAGLYRLSNEIYKLLRKAGVPLPEVAGSSPVLGRYILYPNRISDDPVEACLPGPSYVTMHNMCPYKLLRDFLLSREVQEPRPPDALAERYAVKIRHKLVSGPTLRGRIQ